MLQEQTYMMGRCRTRTDRQLYTSRNDPLPATPEGKGVALIIDLFALSSPKSMEIEAAGAQRGVLSS